MGKQKNDIDVPISCHMKFLTTTDKHSHAKGNSRKAIHEKLLKLKTTDNAETDLVHKPSLSIHRGREPAAPLRASSYPHCGGQAKLGPPARGYSEFTHSCHTQEFFYA